MKKYYFGRMEILHVSAECYPVAKAGGLGDVVGALPKYQNLLGHIAKVVMPMYRKPFLFNHEFDVVHKGGFYIGRDWREYTIIKERKNILGFDLYLVDINSILDREEVYGYDDDSYRFIAFQTAVVDWLSHWQHRPDILHVHDHHAALVPFMIKHCHAYDFLGSIKTVLTIHNGQYQGWMGWDQSYLLPSWDNYKWGLLDWNNVINPLAAGIRCADRVNTVSRGYLNELKYNSKGLESLFEYEKGKCYGILNGIDTDVWNPTKDKYLMDNYNATDYQEGKRKNKEYLCRKFNLDMDRPLFVFIGRLVDEKAADLLPQAITDSLYHLNKSMNFLVLGSGDKGVEHRLNQIKSGLFGYYNAYIGYNEELSHIMYAGADFLLMPSRVEPCGLNQMYAMRYGTVPVVRRTGGLGDTVVDYGDQDGYGVCFDNANVGDMTHAIYRALVLYGQKAHFNAVVQKIMNLDNSWEKSAEIYINLYHS